MKYIESVEVKDDDGEKVIRVKYDSSLMPFSFNVTYVPEKDLPFLKSMIASLAQEMVTYGYVNGKHEVQDSIKKALGFMTEGLERR